MQIWSSLAKMCSRVFKFEIHLFIYWARWLRNTAVRYPKPKFDTCTYLSFTYSQPGAFYFILLNSSSFSSLYHKLPCPNPSLSFTLFLSLCFSLNCSVAKVALLLVVLHFSFLIIFRLRYKVTSMLI